MIKNCVLIFSFIAVIAASCNDYIKSEIVMYYTDSIPKLEYFYNTNK